MIQKETKYWTAYSTQLVKAFNIIGIEKLLVHNQVSETGIVLQHACAP